MATRAPRRANSSAMPRPIPVAPPVINAVCPASVTAALLLAIFVIVSMASTVPRIERPVNMVARRVDAAAAAVYHQRAEPLRWPVWEQGDDVADEAIGI